MPAPSYKYMKGWRFNPITKRKEPPKALLTDDVPEDGRRVEKMYIAGGKIVIQHEEVNE